MLITNQLLYQLSYTSIFALTFECLITIPSLFRKVKDFF